MIGINRLAYSEIQNGFKSYSDCFIHKRLGINCNFINVYNCPENYESGYSFYIVSFLYKDLSDIRNNYFFALQDAIKISYEVIERIELKYRLKCKMDLYDSYYSDRLEKLIEIIESKSNKKILHY